MTSFQNPLGFQMPDDNKRALVALLARHDVPLIEDDVYAELYLRGPRPTPAKAFDRKGLVLHCASFSKSLAPGFRVGWVAPGRFRRQITRRQLTTTLATTAPTQWAIVEYLRHGGFDRHLRGLRQTLMQQQCLMSDAIERHFPAGTRLSRPQRGVFPVGGTARGGGRPRPSSPCHRGRRECQPRADVLCQAALHQLSSSQLRPPRP
jgi:DNA-binding transcriptional MocR family regulator